MADHIRWGILGASKFAREQMGPALHAAAGGTLAALATSSPDKAKPFLGISPELRVIDSYDALLGDPDIDAVYIPLPNHMHAEWTQSTLEAGKHALVEKPATLRASEFDQLIKARDASGKLAAEAYMIVFHPQWQRVKELLDEGVIGTLMHVDGAFSFNNRTDVGNIRNKAETGGGGLRDIGVYVIGSTRFVTGQEPERVSSHIRWENGFDTFAQIWAEFPTFTYSSFVSIRMHPRQEMTFHGDEGLIRVTVPFNADVFGGPTVEIHRDGLTSSVERFPGGAHYQRQVAAFNASAMTGVDYLCPLEFSRGTQEFMDRVFAEAQELAPHSGKKI